MSPEEIEKLFKSAEAKVSLAERDYSTRDHPARDHPMRDRLTRDRTVIDYFEMERLERIERENRERERRERKHIGDRGIRSLRPLKKDSDEEYLNPDWDPIDVSEIDHDSTDKECPATDSLEFDAKIKDKMDLIEKMVGTIRLHNSTIRHTNFNRPSSGDLSIKESCDTISISCTGIDRLLYSIWCDMKDHKKSKDRKKSKD